MAQVPQIPEAYSPTHMGTADGLELVRWQIIVSIVASDAQMIGFNFRV